MLNEKIFLVMERATGRELAAEEDVAIARNKLVAYLIAGIDAYLIEERNTCWGHFRS